MHILILPSEYPTSDHKLGGIFTFEQEKYLKRKNKLGVIYIYLFSLKKIFSSLFFKILSSEKKNKQKFFFYFPRIPYFKLINYYLHYFFFLKLFKKYIKKNGKPDLIHVHFSEFSILTAYKIKQEFKIPYILTEHSTDFLDGKYNKKYKKNSNIYKKINKALLNSKKIICVSSILKQKIKEYYNIESKKFTVIPNLSKNLEYNFKKKSNDIIFVGSLDERKNPMLLIKAYEKINNNKLRMKIIGDGYLRSKIENYIKGKNVFRFISIYKNLNRTKVLKSIGESKVLVLPSNYETFGIVIIEAYSMGVPVIMTDSLGVRDLNHKDCSILVKKNNVNNLAKSIIKILKNNKYKHDKIVRYYKTNFSPSVVTRKIQKLYSS